MYLHKISLTDIRGFRSLEFNLQRPDKSYAGWTVFTGDNGSGKSTLLKAIAMGLVGPDTRRPLQPSFGASAEATEIIDAHLHPEWQREIGFWLKRHFPHIQFLVTTHSPIICQAADPNGLFVLPEPGSGLEPHPLSRGRLSEDHRVTPGYHPLDARIWPSKHAIPRRSRSESGSLTARCQKTWWCQTHCG